MNSGQTLGKDASLAPASVTQISEGQHARERRQSKLGRKATTVVKHIKTDLRVWRKAMEVAQGDRARLQVKEPDVIVVHNNRNWRQR